MASIARATGMSRRSNTAAIESINGISVRIATARSTTKSARSSRTGRSASTSTYSRFTVSSVQYEYPQLDAELTVSYRSLRRRIEQFARTHDSPAIDLVGPIEIDEVYLTPGLKGRERDRESRSRGLWKRDRGSYAEDKPPMFTLVDRGSGQQYVVPAKSADESYANPVKKLSKKSFERPLIRQQRTLPEHYFYIFLWDGAVCLGSHHSNLNNGPNRVQHLS